MKIVLCWSTYDREVDISLEHWRRKPVSLTAFHYLPLLSHVKREHDIDLYTYQNISISYVPKGIKLRNADAIFPAKYAFNALSRGHSIAHISDGVRLAAASKVKGGVPLDMDAVVINSFPEEPDIGWFATSPAKVTGGVAYQWGKNHPPLVVHDRSWNGKAVNMFPIIINDVMKPEVNRLVNKIFKTLSRPPIKNSKGWNYVMWSLGEMIKVDTGLITCEPIVFCPVPGWLPSGKCYSLESPSRLDGKTKTFGYFLPSINEILKTSITVQHCFESVYSFTNKPELAKSFWVNVKGGSLVSREAEYVLGSDWRKVLNEYANES